MSKTTALTTALADGGVAVTTINERRVPVYRSFITYTDSQGVVHEVDNRRNARGDYNRAWRDYESKPRVYVEVHGEKFDVAEDLTNRTRRPWQIWKPLVAEALEATGIGFTKLRWSQHAGCTMCPCSPGFVLEGSTLRNADVWVTLTDAPTVDESKPGRQLV